MTPSDMAARLLGCEAYDDLPGAKQDALCRDLIRIPALLEQDEWLRIFADQKEHTRRSAKLQSALSTILDIFNEPNMVVVHAMEALADHPLGKVDAVSQFRAMAEAMRDHLARLELELVPFPGQSWLEARLIVLQLEKHGVRVSMTGKENHDQANPGLELAARIAGLDTESFRKRLQRGSKRRNYKRSA
jgi:hypothetical protein